MKSRQQGGMTLIEILVVLAIFGVLLSMVANGMFKEYHKRNFQNDLAQLSYYFEQARSISVKTSSDQTVKLTPSGTKVVLTITPNTTGLTSSSTSTATTTVTFDNLSMCESAGNGCLTDVEVTYLSPHGEMCWSSACLNQDGAVPFIRSNYKAKIILQGVFGYASIRNLQ